LKVYTNMIEPICLSVGGGWRSYDNASKVAFGPVFNDIQELWDWQRNNPVEGMKLVKNLMSGEYIMIAEDTPWCCNPASETYWSM